MEDIRDCLKIYIQETAFISLFRDPLYDVFFYKQSFQGEITNSSITILQLRSHAV